MRKILFITVFSCFITFLSAQSILQRIQAAWKIFETDSQLKYAISSLYIIDAKTGKLVFDKNSRVGLAPASTQKIITAATAFELLGKDFSYKTDFGYYGKIDNGLLAGTLYLKGSGDPTLGSPRFRSTTEKFYLDTLYKSMAQAGIKNSNTSPVNVLIDVSSYDNNGWNENWIWEDIGNYFGAYAGPLNWRENQFDAVLKPGNREGANVDVLHLSPVYTERTLDIDNRTLTGKKGSGDQTNFYINPRARERQYSMYLRGTAPAGVDSFVVSGSHPDPASYFTASFLSATDNAKYYYGGDSSAFLPFRGKPVLLYAHSSPALADMIYWFLQKSINLYGEAFVKTLAYQKNGFGTTDSGLAIIKNFWKVKGIDDRELAIRDGSGLSPQNRVTTHAQVQILQYAKKQSWFAPFYAAFPEYNNMKMKSGTIQGVKGFCGYHQAKDGKEYIFSFLVNNYNGPTSQLVNKMYRVLDVLK